LVVGSQKSAASRMSIRLDSTGLPVIQFGLPGREIKNIKVNKMKASYINYKKSYIFYNTHECAASVSISSDCVCVSVCVSKESYNLYFIVLYTKINALRR